MVALRPLDLTDVSAIAAAVEQSRHTLSRWMAWCDDRYDIRAAQSWVETALTATAAGQAAHFAILTHTDTFVGIISLEDLNQQTGRAMLGYWVATPAAGQGIGRRAIALALDWARTQAALRLVWAVVAEANVASRRVLELNRFRLVGSRGVDERGDNALLYELELQPAAA